MKFFAASASFLGRPLALASLLAFVLGGVATLVRSFNLDDDV